MIYDKETINLMHKEAREIWNDYAAFFNAYDVPGDTVRRILVLAMMKGVRIGKGPSLGQDPLEFETIVK